MYQLGSNKFIGAAVLLILFLAPQVEAAVDLDTPLIPMAEYDRFDYRTLNCYECFEAQGRMCHQQSYRHDAQIVKILESGNSGNGLCCKNDASRSHCGSNSDIFTCSMPSISNHGVDRYKEYKDVYSLDNRNYQMFAFCPGIDQKKCGISAEGHKEHDFVIKAMETEQTIHTEEMRYRYGRIPDKEYDACHYMIKNGMNEEGNGRRRLDGHGGGHSGGKVTPTIYFKVMQMENMNVYIYGGKDRDHAYIPLVPMNEMPALNEVYMIDAAKDDGILVVAFPEKNQMDTKLKFSYWAEEIIEEGALDDLANDQSEEDFIMMLIASGMGYCMLCICCCVICVIRRKRIQAHKIAQEVSPEPTDRQFFEQGEGGRISPDVPSQPLMDELPPMEAEQQQQQLQAMQMELQDGAKSPPEGGEVTQLEEGGKRISDMKLRFGHRNSDDQIRETELTQGRFGVDSEQ